MRVAAESALLLCATYFIVVGWLTLVSPELIAGAVNRGEDPSCDPWIRLIGPMAIPFGVSLILLLVVGASSTIALHGLIVLGISQVPLDLYLLSNDIYFWQLGVDIAVLTVGSLAAILIVQDRKKHHDSFVPLRRPALDHSRHLRPILYVLAAYLVAGWFWAVFLPQAMNEHLRYQIVDSCVAWVQFTGPLALAMAAIVVLGAFDPIRHALPLATMVIGGCAIEVALDLFFISRGIFQLWQVSLDLLVATASLISIVCFSYNIWWRAGQR